MESKYLKMSYIKLFKILKQYFYNFRMYNIDYLYFIKFGSFLYTV